MKIEEDLDNQMKMMSNNYNEFIGDDDDYKRVLVGAGARILFYPTLFYNVWRNKMQSEFRWWDQIDQYLLLGAVLFPKDVPRLKELGVGGVITLNEPYETLVPTSLYSAHDIDHLVIPTRDYLFAPSFYDIDRAVEFIHRNATSGKTTYVHCKAGRGRSTTIVLCYLVEYKHMTPDSALEYVRSRRPRVLLAPSQWKAVQEFKDWQLASTVPPSPSRDAVLITKADLEGYSSPSHSKELAIVSGSHVS
ncbi:putative dual specificity protein phosphatase DSP8 [Tanacetum coccineum]|uniref:Dual specificity protein phosphatase DSP8 n=1 Tax=Tanacetum coccineum TaxID=301880 RepID=A0ABQ5FWB7_9ASTR